jgi:DNA-binding transcriptional ArsR family regulator
MDETQALSALAALAQPTRLAAFRLAVGAAPRALPAGEIARALATPHNTLSTHLAILRRAGLLAADRRGRSILYRADLDGFRALVDFLASSCCAGRPEICAPLFDSLSPSCRPDDAAHDR